MGGDEEQGTAVVQAAQVGDAWQATVKVGDITLTGVIDQLGADGRLVDVSLVDWDRKPKRRVAGWLRRSARPVAAD